MVTAAAGLGRTVVLQQKSSGTWHSLGVARNYRSVRSYVPTKRKRGQDVFHGMWLVFEEDVRFPGVVPRT